MDAPVEWPVSEASASAGDYRSFLEAKIATPPSVGLPCEVDEVRSHLTDGRPMKDHVRHIVAWAVRGGRRGIFASFGLHKTMMQLEIGRLITTKTGCLGLIVLPLGVRREFMIDAALLDIDVEFIRSNADLDASLAAGTHPFIYLTNYESAVTLGRRGAGIELNADYWRQACRYCGEAEAERAVPDLFDLLEAEAA